MPIEVKNLSHIYSKGTPFECVALKDVSLTIEDGSFTCIVGRTGCGKSTLVQHLNGLLLPTKGEILFQDFILSSDKKRCTKKLSSLRSKIGIVFQFPEYQLFEETVEKDVIFGPLNFGVKKEDALKIAHECLTKVNIDESFYNKSPFELSGGEKRRVAIAGLLASSPDVLILDELTAGLDPSGAKELLELFKLLNKEGKTIILVTHDMNIVFEYASDVVVMKEGTVAKHCKPQDLFLLDESEYSLETPLIAQLISKLNDKGMKLDLSKIRDIDSLVSEIKKERNK